MGIYTDPIEAAVAQGVSVAHKGNRAGELGGTANWLASFNDVLMRADIALDQIDRISADLEARGHKGQDDD